jgi:hypothetical protein
MTIRKSYRISNIIKYFTFSLYLLLRLGHGMAYNISNPLIIFAKLLIETILNQDNKVDGYHVFLTFNPIQARTFNNTESDNPLLPVHYKMLIYYQSFCQILPHQLTLPISHLLLPSATLLQLILDLITCPR